jgi:hypothetical protein
MTTSSVEFPAVADSSTKEIKDKDNLVSIAVDPNELKLGIHYLSFIVCYY